LNKHTEQQRKCNPDENGPEIWQFTPALLTALTLFYFTICTFY